MPERSVQDRWSTWLLHTRFAGNLERKKAYEEFLLPVRDRVLAHAAIEEGDTLLDVGAGDGLIAFGALPLIGRAGRVIFSDVSQDLLDHAGTLAEQSGELDRVEFVRLSADDLTGIADSSVDAVTTRSVLIYVANKVQAFSEFYRVLRPGGRLSIFEPINRFGHPEPAGMFHGADVRPVEDLAVRVQALYDGLQPMDTDPMLDFDERDLLATAEGAGFAELHLEYSADIQGLTPSRWEDVFHSSGNPQIPTLADAIEQTLSPMEAERFIAYLRPRIENGEGIRRSAVAYLWATK